MIKNFLPYHNYDVKYYNSNLTNFTLKREHNSI